MKAIRRSKLESMLHEELSCFIRAELNDPRIHPLTITQVKITEDAGMATVYFTLFGVESTQKDSAKKYEETLSGLNSAKPFVRRFVAGILHTRNTPELSFKIDKGIENTTRVQELLNQINKETRS